MGAARSGRKAPPAGSLRIVQLTAENFKKIRAIQIRPDGAMVSITGKNANGKSSILDAIWAAVAGADHIQAEPIRRGETKARIRLDLGDIIVERRFTEKGSTLNVENVDGARYPSPQKMLDALVGELSFDPLLFTRQKPKEQFDSLRQIANVDWDFAASDDAAKADYEKRAELNRQAKAERAAAAAIVVFAGLPAEPIDEDELLDKFQNAAQFNEAIAERQRLRQALEQRIAGIRVGMNNKIFRAEELRREADELVAGAGRDADVASDLQRGYDEASAIEEPLVLDELRIALEKAKQTNIEIGQAATRQKKLDAAELLEAKATGLSMAMEARENAKNAAIQSAEMPVPGLGFGDGVVTFNGIPFDQCSSAEQLRVSLAIAMEANPKLRVIRIQDGSLLDSDSLAEIEAMARANEYQIWIERVDASGKIGFVIEDGEVVAVNASEPVGETQPALGLEE